MGAERLAVEFALVLLHAATIWGAAAIIRLPATLLRTPNAWSWRLNAWTRNSSSWRVRSGSGVRTCGGVFEVTVTMTTVRTVASPSETESRR